MNRNLISLVLICSIYQQLNALPTGFSKVTGQAKQPYIDKSGAMIVESGKRAVIEWDSFSVQTQETLRFTQKDKSSAVLNRVTGSDLSSILGTLTSNGKVFLVNPNGILIGENGLIQTAGFLASTANITNQEFMKALPLKLNQFSSGSIVNLGTIQASTGDVGLFARTVRNAGTLSAPEGSVHIGSAPQILLKPNEEQHLYISLEGDNDFVPTIENTGLIEALSIEIQSASSVYDKAISLGGKIDASKIMRDGNRVFLKAENSRIEISGIIDNPGGYVNIEGKDVHLTKTSKVDVSSSSGHAGRIDLNALDVCAYEGEVSGQALGESGDGGYFKLYGQSLFPNGPTNFSAKYGKSGTINLDPDNIIVAALAAPTLTNILFCDANTGVGSTTISGLSIVALLALQNVILQAANDITITDSIVAAPGNANSLTLAAGRSIAMTSGGTPPSPPTINTQSGTITITINSPVPAPCSGNRLTGGALFSMTPGSTITTGSSITITASNFGGVFQGAAHLDGATISSTNSNVNLGPLFGTPAGSPTSQAAGVEIVNASLITASGPAPFHGIAITGTGSTDVSQPSTAYGVHINGSTITATGTFGGLALVQGVGGGTSAGNNNYGAVIENGSSVQGLATARVQMICTGGAGTSNAAGLIIDASTVKAANNTMILTGTGGTAGGTENTGVIVSNITASNFQSPSITITGDSGSNGTDDNYGIQIINAILDNQANGTIAMTGTSHASGNTNYGISIESNSNIETSGTGTQTYLGTGSASGNGNCHGISVDASAISTINGLATFTGDGGGNSSGHGISITNTSTLKTFGSGGLTFTGTGSSTGDNLNFGFALDNSSVFSAGGSGLISITGTGNGSTDNNSGCVFSTGAIVSSSGTGNIVINGTGDLSNAGTSSNYGVTLGGSSTSIGTNTSNITVTGIGNGQGDSNTGIFIESGAQIVSTSGIITLNGTGASATSLPLAPSPAPPITDNNGIEITGSGSNVTVITGIINMTGTGGNPSPVLGRNGNNGILIADSALVINQGANGITLTGHGGTGVDFNNGISLVTLGSVESNGASTITFNGDAQGSGDQNCGISINPGNLITTNGVLSLTGTGSTNGVNENSGIQILGSTTTVDAGTGNITMNGTGGAGTAGVGDNNDGIVMSDIIIHSTGSGAISLTGFGPLTPANSDNDGVALIDCDLRTANGDIIINGTAKGNNNANFGTEVNSTTLETTGTGNIQITGTGGIGLTNNDGIIINVGSTLQTVNGNIQISGQGNGSQINNDGIYIADNTIVTSIGSGSFTIQGIAGAGTDGNVGLNTALGANFSTNSGNIQFQGTGDGTGDGNSGISLGNVSVASTSGTISMTGQGSVNATGNLNIGVSLGQNSEVDVSPQGLTVMGTGGTGTSQNVGVVLFENLVSTDLGNITMTGIGGNGQSAGWGLALLGGTINATSDAVTTLTGTGNNATILSAPYEQNFGVVIDELALINTLGFSADVILTGTGSANGTDLNLGVVVGRATINCGGVFRATGTGQGDGQFNHGILVKEGVINGTNTVYLNGTASTLGTNFCGGVVLDAAKVSSADCSVNVTAAGGTGNPSTNPGFLQQDISSVISNTQDINITSTQGDIIVIDGTLTGLTTMGSYSFNP